ncbi:primosomal protein DnaI [Lactobacillus alvi]|uniref:Primosomal protein DnaI n=1 Tax=Limosilactobacillus alvi TaxID=990412 RepID=A0ABS2ENZ5_9LACO|nr:primosomal protein DnaI [Limosilactobacillus alvi]MBM6753941.1 primosomal protein DnaI [Limosilactobacillus alvi]
MESVNQTMDGIINPQGGDEAYRKIMKAVFADPEVQSFLRNHQDELDQESINRGSSKLYEFVHDRDLVKQGKASVAPGYVPRLAISAGQIDVVYVPTEQLRAQRAAAKQRSLVETLAMPKFIANATFENAFLEGENASEYRNVAFQRGMRFVHDYSPSSFMPGMYLTGEFGVGKTFLLGAIANGLARERGIQSILIHFPTFAVSMKSSIGKNTTDLERDRIKQAPILMIDDIGADAMSAWVRDEVLGVILEYRMQMELPTFFSSNFTMVELEKHLAVDVKGDQEPLKAKRIMERIRFLSREVTVGGDNLRQKLGKI